jgi:hypothetical protein
MDEVMIACEFEMYRARFIPPTTRSHVRRSRGEGYRDGIVPRKAARGAPTD